MPYGEDSEHKNFVNNCLQKLDRQAFRLESEQAKISAIQLVQREMRAYLINRGMEAFLEIIRYPDGRKDISKISDYVF